jgi:hypothetical protein
LGGVCCAALLLPVQLTSAQLYTQNFDIDDSSNWTATAGPTSPVPVDEVHDFFFDYSTKGIPSAPNSTGGTTRGMMLAANLSAGVFGGVSTSPTGQSFTGDYKVSFDLWTNFIGSSSGGVNVIGATPGSTMLSTAGIMTSGTFANRAGAADGIFFAATGNVSSSAFRAYSSERMISYQLPHFIGEPPDPTNPANFDNQTPPQPIDSHAVYAAGTTSNNPETGGGSEVYYQNAFPSVTVPAAQTAMFPATQFGSTQPGTIGFAWHEVEIAKLGNTVTWKIDDTLLVTLDTTNYKGGLPAGTNISFGHADVNDGISADPFYPLVSFTLIDNITVEIIAAPGVPGDYNDDGTVDVADYVLWRNGGPLDNEVDNPGTVNAADYTSWRARFGNAAGGQGSLKTSEVPEPSTSLILILAGGSMIGRYRKPASPSYRVNQ